MNDAWTKLAETLATGLARPAQTFQDAMYAARHQQRAEESEGDTANGKTNYPAIIADTVERIENPDSLRKFLSNQADAFRPAYGPRKTLNFAFCSGSPDPLPGVDPARRFWAVPPEDDFDARIELRILAAQLRMRVHVEILGNRAKRDIAIETHRVMRDFFKSIQYGAHHAEI